MKKRGRKMTNIYKIMLSMLLIGLVALSVFTYAPVMYADNQYVFKIGFSGGPQVKVGKEIMDNDNYVVLKTFKELVEKDTKGRMKVELFLNGRLGDIKSYLEQIHAGLLEGALPAEGDIAPLYKDIQILSIPYCFRDVDQFYSIIEGKFGKKLLNDIAQKSKIRVLGINFRGFRSFSNSKRLVKTADDMKGLKIRTMNMPIQMEMVKALGASPTPVAWEELYNALQTGVVDGQANPAQTMLNGSIQEVQKYYTLDKHAIGLTLLVTSEKYLKSLPKDIRVAVLNAGRNAAKAGCRVGEQNESIALEHIKKSCTIYSPTSSERDTFRKRVQSPCVKWLKANTNHSKWVDELLKLTKK
jgi:tripartite ATP-independent transporter DctP family solute receptor